MRMRSRNVIFSKQQAHSSQQCSYLILTRNLCVSTHKPVTVWCARRALPGSCSENLSAPTRPNHYRRLSRGQTASSRKGASAHGRAPKHTRAHSVT